jgi:hypothetical protein
VNNEAGRQKTKAGGCLYLLPPPKVKRKSESKGLRTGFNRIERNEPQRALNAAVNES